MTTLVLAMALLVAAGQGADIAVPILTPPTRDAAMPTDAEMSILRAGFALYQQKKFDDAIAKYEEVLAANPNSAAAMYEIAASLLGKGEFAKAIEMARRSTDFRSNDLDKSYAFFGTAFDMMKEPQKAIEAYDRAIALLPTAGTLYYNKAITQMQSLKDAAGGIVTLKTGAVADPRHAATQMTLGQMYLSENMKTPAFFALSRVLIVEPGSQRGRQAFQAWYPILANNIKVGADGKATMNVNPRKSTTEGDMAKMDIQIGLSQIAAGAKGPDLSPSARLVFQLDALFGAWAQYATGDDADKFMWTYYLPYFLEMREKKFVEPFVYYVTQTVGMPGSREWVYANGDAVKAFLAWDKAYAWK